MSATRPKARPGEGNGLERLQKVMARAGVASRRACEEMIEQGRVRVNGAVAALGQKVDPTADRVELDGVVLAVGPDLVHYLLNKPAGVLSTAADTHNRPTVVSLVPCLPRVYPVGRLDAQTEGLIILTNDGELALRLTHPSYGVEKEYLVQVRGNPSASALASLRRGVVLDDGPTEPARVGVMGRGVLRIVIHEGRKRQVRRMCEAVGHPVLRLVRTRIGPLSDPSLGPGQWRKLSASEVRDLARAAGNQRKASRRSQSPQPAPSQRWS